MASCPELDALGVRYQIVDGRARVLPSVPSAIRVAAPAMTPESAATKMTYSRYAVDPQDGEDALVRAIARGIDNPDEIAIRDAIHESAAESARRLRSIPRLVPSSQDSLLANDILYGFADMDGVRHLCVQEGPPESLRVIRADDDAVESAMKSVIFPLIAATVGGVKYMVTSAVDARRADGTGDADARDILEAIEMSETREKAARIAACLASARRNLLAVADLRTRMRPAVAVVPKIRSLVAKWEGQGSQGMIVRAFLASGDDIILDIQTDREGVYVLLATDLTVATREDELGVEYQLSKAEGVIYNEQNVPKRKIDLSPTGPQTYRNVAEFGNRFLRPIMRSVARAVQGFMRRQPREGR